MTEEQQVAPIHSLDETRAKANGAPPKPPETRPILADEISTTAASIAPALFSNGSIVNEVRARITSDLREKRALRRGDKPSVRLEMQNLGRHIRDMAQDVAIGWLKRDREFEIIAEQETAAQAAKQAKEAPPAVSPSAGEPVSAAAPAAGQDVPGLLGSAEPPPDGSS